MNPIDTRSQTSAGRPRATTVADRERLNTSAQLKQGHSGALKQLLLQYASGRSIVIGACNIARRYMYTRHVMKSYLYMRFNRVVSLLSDWVSVRPSAGRGSSGWPRRRGGGRRRGRGLSSSPPHPRLGAASPRGPPWPGSRRGVPAAREWREARRRRDGVEWVRFLPRRRRRSAAESTRTTDSACTTAPATSKISVDKGIETTILHYC